MTSDFKSFAENIALSCKKTAYQPLQYRKTGGFSFLLSVFMLVTVVSISVNSTVFAQNVWDAEVQTINIEPPKFHVRNLSGPAGRQLRIKIRLPKDLVTPNSSLTFYGLPDKILLSAGVRKSKVWIVPVSKAKRLSLIAPRGFRGVFESAAILRKKNGQVIEGQRFVVNILKYNAKKPAEKPKVAKKKPEPKEKPAKKPEPKKQRVVKLQKEKQLSPSQKAYKALSLSTTGETEQKPKKTISDDLEETLLSKGKQLLKDGNIDAARETFKFLADQGNAESAFLVARTYDPEEFKSFNAIGVEPDLEEAKKWYTKAAKLGSKTAQSKLREYAKAGL